MSELEDSEFREALEHLQALVRFDTSNPPGNETAAARYLKEVFFTKRIDAQLIESRPGRGSVVARLKGDGSRKPLLLLSHLDVVPADCARWSVGPFSGEIRDGYLWGRGTLDMKYMTAMSLAAMLRLKRKGVKLHRDVIFAAVADEEAGGALGAGYLVENHPELLRAEYALCEMGGFRLDVRGRTYYPVQVAERGCAWCRVRFAGRPGHGSLPDANSSILKMARALKRLGRRGLPLRVTQPVRSFVRQVGVKQNPLVRLALRALLNPLTAGLVLRTLPPEQARFFYAQLHSTAVPTVVRAGDKENVIPAEAEVTLDGRVLPGQDWESFRKQLARVLGREAEIELVRWMEPLIYPSDTPLFDSIQRVVRHHDAGGEAVPYLLTAFTDAKHLDRLGIVTYGFSPLGNRADEKLSDLIHGNDERIELSAFAWGLKVLGDVVEDFCAAAIPPPARIGEEASHVPAP